MAIKIGITGGIGSGKSVVSHLLEVMGVPVYISDEESKKVVATDPVIRKELCDLVGEEVFSGGKLNKTLLATYLFASSTHASQVNGIIHPRVKEHFRQWSSHKDVSGYNRYGIGNSDRSRALRMKLIVIVMVYAPLELRVEPVRCGVTMLHASRLVARRIRSQMSDEEKCERASFVIINDGEKPLIPQILELIAFLYQKIHYLCSAKNN